MLSIGRRRLAGIASRDEMKTVIVAAALTIEQGKLLVTQRKKDWKFRIGIEDRVEQPPDFHLHIQFLL